MKERKWGLIIGFDTPSPTFLFLYIFDAISPGFFIFLHISAIISKETLGSGTVKGDLLMGKRIKSNNSSKRKRKDKWLWIIGWILVFPILATIYLNKEYKNKKKDVKYYSLLGTAWAIYLLLVVVIAPAQKKIKS